MSNKVLIIGGGLGGLALGQGLKQAGVDFQIFERDEASSFRAQGYRIRIDRQGGSALQQVLPTELYKLFELTSSKVVPGGHAVAAETGQEKSSGFSRMPPQTGPAWNIDRTVVRNVLLSGLQQHVSFGKKFECYELVEDGIIAHFADGSSVLGTFLVGADGIWSRVRHQLLPDSRLLDTEGRAIFGKTEVDNNRLLSIPDAIEEGITLTSAADEPHLKLFCDVMHFDQTLKDSGLKIDIPKDYIYWVLVFTRSQSGRTDEFLADLSNEKSAQLAIQMTSSWHSSIRSILEQQTKTAASTLFFFMSKPPLETWLSNSKISLLGDAFHPMPPIGGVGANLAFQDAADLLKVLLPKSQSQALVDYETAARNRGNEALQRAAGGGANFFGMKPVQDLLPVDFHA